MIERGVPNRLRAEKNSPRHPSLLAAVGNDLQLSDQKSSSEGDDMCKQRFIWSGIVSMFLIFIGAAGVYAATLFSDNFNRTGSGLGANWMIATGSYTTNGAQAISGSGSTSNWAK